MAAIRSEGWAMTEHGDGDRRPFTLVDVFAARPHEGTLHAVVHDADGLSDETLAVLARRFNLPETSFVQTATVDGAEYRHRIFTIEGEIPFAGHPSLGTAAAVAYRHGERRASYVQQTVAGTQPVSVELDEMGAGRASIRQNHPIFDAVHPFEPLADALGLPADARDPELEVQLVSTGLPTVIVPLRDIATLAAAEPRPARLAAVLEPIAGRATNCYAVAELEPGRWRARCFAVDIPGGEDPATGSAAGPLGAYLRQYRGLQSLVVEQGIEMRRPSLLEVDVTDGVVVSGGVFVAGQGDLRLR